MGVGWSAADRCVGHRDLAARQRAAGTCAGARRLGTRRSADESCAGERGLPSTRMAAYTRHLHKTKPANSGDGPTTIHCLVLTLNTQSVAPAAAHAVEGARDHHLLAAADADGARRAGLEPRRVRPTSRHPRRVPIHSIMAFPRCTTRGPGPRRAQPTAAPGRAPASSRHARWGRTTRRSQAPAPEAWAEGGTGAGEPYLGAARPRPPAWETVRGRRSSGESRILGQVANLGF
uniref:Uncharacterized protein n=1 Tax=Setaria italica TaxID=4555 RepID=K3XZ55_SETIT